MAAEYDTDKIKRLCHFVLDELSRKDRGDSPWLTITEEEFAGSTIRTVEIRAPQKDLNGTIMVADNRPRKTGGGGKHGRKKHRD